MRRFILLTIILFSAFLKASYPVKAQSLTAFSFSDLSGGSDKTAGLPLALTIPALDENSQVLTTFNNSVNLSDTTGTISPTQTTSFTNGVWNGWAYITSATSGTVISANYSSITSNSDSFAVSADSRIKFLTIISGNSQTGSVGSQLPTAFTIRAVDPYNNPLSNIGVNFALTGIPPNSLGQALTNTSANTNASGNASTILTLGRKSGTYIITATLNSGITTAAHFYANAIPGPIASIGITPSVGVVPAGSILPFFAKAYDQYANELTAPFVTWSVLNGGGTIDGSGVFQAGTTLGTYMNTVRALSGSIGSTASVTIVGAAGEAGGTATSSGVTLPTPIPTITPVPTPTLAPGILYDVQVDPSVISALVNARIPIIAEGVDIFGNTAPGVTYNFDTTGNLGTLTQIAPNQVILTTTSGGLGTVTVTATQGNVTRTTTIAGSVGNGLNRRLVIEEVSSPQSVGVPFTLSIAAKDSDNNFITDYSGPIVIADSTGTIDPSVVQPSQTGIWYVQVTVSVANPEVSVTAAGDGMVGVSNIFEVIGSPQQSEVGPGFGGLGGGEGAGGVLGASISAILDKLLIEKDLNKFSIFRYIGAGLAAGMGILGTSIGGGIMASRGLEAIGRNPYAKSRLQINLYASLVAFIVAASLAVLASFLILG